MLFFLVLTLVASGDIVRVEEFVQRLRQQDEGIIDSIIEIGSPAVPVLCEILVRGGEPRLIKTVSVILGKIGDSYAVPSLVHTLKSSSHSLRSAAATALGDIQDSSATFPLLKLLRDPHDAVRGDAAEAIGKIGDPRATDSLLLVIEDPVPVNRAKAVGALGMIAEKRSIPILRDLLLSDDAEIVRMSSAIAIGQIEDTLSVPYLRKAMEDESSIVREKTAVALGEIGTVGALQVLKGGIRDREVSVRLEVLNALFEIGLSGSLLPLIEATEDPDPIVSDSAFSYLERLDSAFIQELWRIAGEEAIKLFIRARAFERLRVLQSPKELEDGLIEIYPEIRREIYIAIIEGEVIEGMTKDQVGLSLGRPRRTAVFPDFEEWDYGNGKPLVIFEKSIVMEVR